MLKVPDVTMLDVAFGARAMDFMPKMEDIPDDFPNRQKWEKVTGTWFFGGLKNAKFTPKAWVDQGNALAAIRSVLGSFAPKHEHKEAAVAYMLSEWFDDVTYDEPDYSKLRGS
jgi:hypothetical protein